MVDGKWKKERFREKYWYQWERCNAIVLSWLMNYVAQNLISEIAYTTNAQTLLKELRERFDKDEFEALVPLPDCDCSKSKDCVVFLQRLKLYQFFMGLNANYLQARSQILLMFPLPTVNQTYAMLISDEIQKAIDVNSGILGASPPNINPGRYDSTTLYSSKTGGNQKFRKNYNFYCEVSPSTISANTTGTSSVFLLSDSKSDWIIDTLATNHMVSDVNLLNKSSISELIVPRKVFLPNRYISHVAHVGTSSISDNNYLRNDLSIGKVKAIGKEYNELYLLHRHNARTNKVFTLAAQGREVVDITLWQTRLTFPSSSIKITTCFNLIHVDVWGPYKTATFDGNRYFLTDVDDFSRMIWIFLLRLKSDVCVVLQQFLVFVQTQFQKTLKVVRIDSV
ncbi:uncharacterized protein [Nicotiana tomentosiformis]|uniref:uncharacterized protein n=1 Tax=Nicotiana tomentosiformis TaxID=4098 RepID=UPI00388C8A7A